MAFSFRRRPVAPPRVILVLRFSSIGDILLCTPIFRALRQKYPNARILFLTLEKYAEVLETNPYIDEIWTINTRVSEISERLRAAHIDTIVDLHKNIRTQQVKRLLAKARYYSYHKLNMRKWLWVNLKINSLPMKSIVQRYFEGLQALELQNDLRGLDYFIPDEDRIEMKKDIPYSHHAGYVVLGIGGSKATKRMPYQKWQELCLRLDFPMIAVGGPDERELGDLLASNIPDKKVYNACGKFGLHETADIIRRSQMVITHDTASMHMAAAFDKKIQVIWGNTSPYFGMYPYLPGESRAWHSAEVPLRCRPCSKIGYAKCPRRHFKCMLNQNLTEIIDGVEKDLRMA